jgi:uncharacterized glyoxalase superfamily protein PhnB
MPEIAMTFGWAIVYVDDPAAASDFYQQTFGLTGEFVGPGGEYAQLDTGTTKLAFAAYGLSERNFPGGVRRAALDDKPANVELALATEEVDAAFARAVDAGCTPLAEPADQPHGQRVAWVRDPFGTLLEIASPL